ncbi:hypothetical protein AGDE_00111 [Angomonas deanei]|uniref:Paraflagellar rod component n=1 Tax=Angomonas deanei TaxID=59799 RepID=S9X5J9_9TRYP|nr:hypothetical protein AGDE_11313 [Angomonas deanei]EPY32133.1 hypothetical protein AGDE_08849 [Angomonas deanei]EPY39558.1 hypothetical protein AGDE_04370 [Angomonas deanei]EPY43810.1 hypothetical protein AGDE_00111 [Angomonas deanei]CAD2217802.1 hypothetical protein, conserved [Angomonas deanei]|eukprot:EPY26449.1 hypothetical protein AGDE_11313 [Angomonas deanei]
MEKTLIVNLTFNCPEISIVGPIKESTIDVLNELIPYSTTSAFCSNPTKAKFRHVKNPSHWSIKLDGQFCDSEGISRLMVILMDALDEEGGWTLVSSQSYNVRSSVPLQQNYVENHKMIFLKSSD